MLCHVASCNESAADKCPCAYCTTHCEQFCRGKCDCRMKMSPEASVLATSRLRWQRLGLSYPSVEHGGRTGIVDFLDALEAIDARLEKYEPAKKGAWRKQSVEEHTAHASQHLEERYPNIEDLIAGALRALMALQVELQKG